MLPQVSGRHRSGWFKCCRGNALRALSALPAVASPALVAVAVLVSLPTQPHEVQFAPCDTSCQQQRWSAQVAEAERQISADVAELTAGRTCWVPGERDQIPSSVVVHDDGGTRVRVLSFAEGLRLARAGKVWVDAVCA